MQLTGGFGLGPSGNEVDQGGGSRMVAAVARAWGVRLFSWTVLFVEVGAEVGDVSAITLEAPPLQLPMVLVAQGLEPRFDVAMMVHILADLHVLGGGISLGLGVCGTPGPIPALLLAMDDGQAGIPGLVPRADHGTWLWLRVWLLMRKLQGLVNVRVLLRLMRMLRGLVDVGVPLVTPRST